MSKVTALPKGEIEAAALLEMVKGNEFKELVIIGIDETGTLYIGAMTDQAVDINALLDVAKLEIISRIHGSVTSSE